MFHGSLSRDLNELPAITDYGSGAWRIFIAQALSHDHFAKRTSMI
jgi:hypothetical protein